MPGDVLVELDGVVKRFTTRGRDGATVLAVNDVSVSMRRGETIGLVGETGCGKSTLARCTMRLHDLTAGRVVFDGTDIGSLRSRELAPFRRRMQMIFQDPYGSLNPRRRVGSIIGDPFAIHGAPEDSQRKRAVQDLMARVGLNPEHYNRYPSAFSGGQRQRIGIARALALSPELLVCDEPVSALDVSIQAQIVNLLVDLQAELGLTYLFITHDLSIVRHVSDRIAIMYLGSLVEIGPVADIFESPQHPYTSALLSALPIADPDVADARRRVPLAGDVPSPLAPPAGCPFHPRCPRAQARCAVEAPVLSTSGGQDERQVACHFPISPAPGSSAEDPSREGRP